MIKKIFLSGLILSSTLYCSGCATYVKHPDFNKRHKDIKTVSVVKPDVEVYKLTFKGDQEMMVDLLKPFADVSKDEIENIFRGKGYAILKLDLSKKALAKNPELKAVLFDLREVFRKRLDDITKRRNKKFRYSLGPDINDLSNISGSDVLIFLKASAAKKSGGEIAKDITRTIIIAAATFGSVISYSYTCWCIIQVAVVDGDTGDILWYNDNYATSQNLDAAKQTQIIRAMRGLFRPFPKISKEAAEKEITPLEPLPETIAPTQEGAISSTVISGPAIAKEAK